MAQRNTIGAEAVKTCEHGGIAGRGGYGGAEHVIEENAALPDIFVDMRCRQTVITVQAHVVAAQAVNTKQQDIRFF